MHFSTPVMFRHVGKIIVVIQLYYSLKGYFRLLKLMCFLKLNNYIPFFFICMNKIICPRKTTKEHIVATC